MVGGWQTKIREVVTSLLHTLFANCELIHIEPLLTGLLSTPLVVEMYLSTNNFPVGSINVFQYISQVVKHFWPSEPHSEMLILYEHTRYTISCMKGHSASCLCLFPHCIVFLWLIHALAYTLNSSPLSLVGPHSNLLPCIPIVYICGFCVTSFCWRCKTTAAIQLSQSHT